MYLESLHVQLLTLTHDSFLAGDEGQTMDLESLHSQLLTLSRESFLAGYHQVACCLLHTAAQCALDLSDRRRLAEVAQLARNRELSLTRQSSAHATVFRSLVKTVAEMLKRLPVVERTPSGADRRTAPRRPVLQPGPLRLFNTDGQSLGIAVADDISETGIRLLDSNSHAIGAVLLVEAGPADSPAPRFAFRVAWCEQLDEGFLVGGPFVPPLPSAETLALLDGL
jgi:hypothetical protein